MLLSIYIWLALLIWNFDVYEGINAWSMLLNIAITFYLIVLWKKVSIVAILDVYLSESTLSSAHWPTVIMCLMSANYSLLLSPASHHNEQRMNLLIGSSKLHEAWLLFVRKPIMSFIMCQRQGFLTRKLIFQAQEVHLIWSRFARINISFHSHV